MTQEQEKLDSILSNPDPLLVQSLRREDRRRRRIRIALGITGGLIMLAIVTTVALSLLVSSPAATAPVDAAKSNTITAEGWQLWQKHELSSALEKFKEAAKLNPANDNAWNGLGWVYFNSGSDDEAKKAWEKCLKIVPDHPAALNGLGQLALMGRQYEAAEKYLLAAAANPNATAAFHGLARLYLLEGKYEQAEKWAQKLVAADPGDVAGSKMLEAAKARKIDPELRSQIEPPPMRESANGKSVAGSGKVDVAKSNTLAMQGWQLWQQRNLPDALEKFREAVKLNPNNANALNGLGWVCFNSGSGDEAKDAWEKCLKAQPGHGAALNGLGQLALSKRQYDKAEKYLLPAANQNATAAWYGLARLYLLQGKYQQAEKWAQKLVAREPSEDANRMLAAAKAKNLDPAFRSEIEPPPAAEDSAPASQEAGPDASTATPTMPSAEATEASRLPLADSFEVGQNVPDGWEQGTPIDGVTYLWDKNTAFDGKASLSIRKTAKRYFPIAEWHRVVAYDGKSPVVKLSAMVKAKDVTKAILDVSFENPSGQDTHEWAARIAGDPAQPPANHDWKQYLGTVKVPPGTKSIIIGLQMYGPGQVWFDNVKAEYVK